MSKKPFFHCTSSVSIIFIIIIVVEGGEVPVRRPGGGEEEAGRGGLRQAEGPAAEQVRFEY